jgi:hypothetical protein
MAVIRRMQALLAAITLMLAASSVARAQNYVIDQGTSDALTRYLRMNELPMVTAQFSTSPAGSAAATGSQSPNSPDQLWNKTMQGIYRNGGQTPAGSGPMLP